MNRYCSIETHTVGSEVYTVRLNGPEPNQSVPFMCASGQTLVFYTYSDAQECIDNYMRNHFVEDSD